MKEEIKVSEAAVKQPKIEAKLVEGLSQIASSVFLLIETSNESETIVKRVNAKSLIGVLSLELKGGETVSVSAAGDDEELAIKKVKEILT